jgi:aldehyde dehydrogenase (NAD+)
MADKFKNFIGGEWVEPSAGEYFENRNPARWSEVIGLWPRSGQDDVDRAVAAAKEAFPAWARTPAPDRGNILRRVGDLLSERKDEIAKAATREMGKVLTETRGDVQEGIDTAYYAGSRGAASSARRCRRSLATSGR